MRRCTKRRAASSIIPGLITVEEIQDLMASAVKAQVKRGIYKTHLYTKPYTKTYDALCIPYDSQPPKF